MAQAQKVVLEGGVGEIVEKKSRFIASVFPVHGEEEVLGIIESMRKKYWDARHNCYAYILGENREVQRYSDDGEPGGTAGRPMLDILLAEDVTDCLVVVTRYFGGTLLGTGGLVRAYQQSTKEGLLSAKIAQKKKGIVLNLEMDYTTAGKVQYLIGNEEENVCVVDTAYTDKVVMQILVCEDFRDAFDKKLTEVTNGRVTINQGDIKVYALADKKLIFL